MRERIADKLFERPYVPDVILRAGIRRKLSRQLRELAASGEQSKRALIDQLRDSPLSVAREGNAAEQKVEPVELYRAILGPRAFFASGYFLPGVERLDGAEECMLRLICTHAGLKNGQEILELGCGWGALSLWMATKYPECRITAFTDVKAQQEFILAEAARLKRTNIDVQLRSLNEWGAEQSYDRIISVEVFDQVRNFGLLLQKVAGAIRPGGKFFVQADVHRTYAYVIESHDDNAPGTSSSDPMAGSIMPSEDIFAHFPEHLAVVDRWRIPGHHYAMTTEAWRTNMDQNRKEIRAILKDLYGRNKARQEWVRWRTEILTREEQGAWGSHHEWYVSHFLLSPA